jgi:hypothetical protein
MWPEISATEATAVRESLARLAYPTVSTRCLPSWRTSPRILSALAVFVFGGHR